ncbi:helix-turn-helix transcriptional regulator [Cloacibacillus porcorum]
MAYEVSVSIRKGIIKIEGQVHLAAGVEGIQQFVSGIEAELIGFARDRGPLTINIPSPAKASPGTDEIRRTGLLTRAEVLKVLNIGRSALDRRIKDGRIPQGGKDGTKRFWNAEVIWAIADRVANNRAEPRESPWLHAKKKAA